VLEFFADGALILHNVQGGIGAQYSSAGGRLALVGPLAFFWRGDVSYEIDGSTLTLDIPALGPLARSQWTRIDRDAFFGVERVAGDFVAAGLPQLLADATTGAARDWRPDAIPVALDLQRLPSGDFATTLTFVSPADLTGLRVVVGRWGFLANELPRASWGDHALPAEFADVPLLRTRLTESGNADPLLSASLRVWSKGPVWTVTTLGAGSRQTRADLAAATGNRIVAEAPPPTTMSEEEYVAQYNAQWQAISEAFARSRATRGGGGSSWDPAAAGWSPGSSDAGGSSEPIGGGCAYSNYAACNAAAAGDLWAADRLENGTSRPSEQAWYD
jgi:hypothetical protein